jgi:tricorn protease
MRPTFLVTALLFLFVPVCLYAQPDTSDTRMLQWPAVSREHIAFIYSDDLWVCDLDGGNPRRLTSHPGFEWHPVFSPDGKTIAYSGQYDCPGAGPGFIGQNIYTVPVTGGEPKRLTWHPGWDLVRDWTPDGQAVLFSSWGETRFWGYQDLCTVSAAGGYPTKLPIPSAWEASYSPDGMYIAYCPYRDPTVQWKNYRGGTHSRIWILRLKDLAVEQIPQPEGRCNDLCPRWMGDMIYFRSDRNGESNLFAYEPKNKAVHQLTHFTDFPVANVAAGGGNVVFEQAGYLHRFDVKSGKSQRLKIGLAAELPETRVRIAQGKGTKYVRSVSVSPNGARVALEFRGEVVTMPAEKGIVRNLTNTTGVHERSPSWSPDGKSIAYFSDEGGEYTLRVRPADGKGAVKTFKLQGTGYYEEPTWSPDGKKIVYQDNSWTLYWLDLDSGNIKKIATEPRYAVGARNSRIASWSPDSKWISYTLNTHAYYRVIYVYSLTEEKSHAVTDGMSDAGDPTFDPSGKFLYFLASTDTGPVNHGFNLSRLDMRATRQLYLTVLQKDVHSPFLPETDEEKEKATKPGEKPTTEIKKTEPFRIDLEGLDRRTVVFPLPAGDYRSLWVGETGQVYYLSLPPALPGSSNPSGAALMRYDVAKRKGDTILSGVAAYRPSADGKKAFVFLAPETYSVVDLTPGVDANKTKLNMETVEVQIDPRAEWRQIFDEAWRLNRDYFYDPGMHGADWPAMKKKYEVFLPHATNANDTYRIIRWMLSELSVSHSGCRPGDRLDELKTTPIGLLGADYEVANGRYRFKKVYAGVPWWPEVKAPLATPGVEVKVGEYLLAVRGTELKAPAPLYPLFANSGGKPIEITVGPNPDGAGARTLTVIPLANFEDEVTLRHLTWVEGNRKKVEQATGGRVAYIYLPDTGNRGFAYFKRYFYAQTDKEAVILDERGNGGGAWADYYLDHLRKPFSSYWALRYGADFRSPSAAILGPKVMLIDEQAGSGGDGLPWMFRQSKLGPLVGKRTWGGEVGTTSFPAMLDGGRVTAPNFALWSPEGGWVVENEGVPPDVDVEQWPADLHAGRDPQLDKAIEIILKELEKNPTPKVQRPPYPVRVRKPG